MEKAEGTEAEGRRVHGDPRQQGRAMRQPVLQGFDHPWKSIVIWSGSNGFYLKKSDSHNLTQEENPNESYHEASAQEAPRLGALSGAGIEGLGGGCGGRGKAPGGLTTGRYVD